MDESKIVTRYKLKLIAPDGSEVASKHFNVWKKEPNETMFDSMMLKGRELCIDALYREGLWTTK